MFVMSESPKALTERRLQTALATAEKFILSNYPANYELARSQAEWFLDETEISPKDAIRNVCQTTWRDVTLDSARPEWHPGTAIATIQAMEEAAQLPLEERQYTPELGLQWIMTAEAEAAQPDAEWIRDGANLREVQIGGSELVNVSESLVHIHRVSVWRYIVKMNSLLRVQL